MRPNNVLMVVNTYAPDDPRVIYSATSLAGMGHSVRLVGAARQRLRPVAGRQVVDGVDVVVTPVAVSGLAGLVGLLGDLVRGRPKPWVMQVRQGRSDVGSLIAFSAWVLRIGLSAPVDVVHCHDLSPLPACWLVARLKRARLVYDIHENVPTMYAGRRGALMTRLELMLVPRVDVVIAAGERLARAMRDRGARRVVHIGNWKRLDEYEPDAGAVEALRRRLSVPEGSLVVSHIGTLDANRELPPLLEAVARAPDVTLLVGGRGADADKIAAAASEHANIRWLGWVDLAAVPAYTALSDAIYYCRSPQQPGGSYELAPAPNKLYEALAAGRPVIARRGVGEIGEILERIPAGILLDDVTVDTVTAALAELRDPDRQRELRAAALGARRQYHWGVAEERLGEVYEDLLGA